MSEPVIIIITRCLTGAQWRSDIGCHPVRYCYGVTPLPALPTPN